MEKEEYLLLERHENVDSQLVSNFGIVEYEDGNHFLWKQLNAFEINDKCVS